MGNQHCFGCKRNNPITPIFKALLAYMGDHITGYSVEQLVFPNIIKGADSISGIK